MKTYELSDGFSDYIRIDQFSNADAIAQFRFAVGFARVVVIETREWKIDDEPCESGSLFLYELDDNGDRVNFLAMATLQRLAPPQPHNTPTEGPTS